MILSNLADYCFVFEPNILKVQCEDTSAPTKEVTLTANGIMLKRNCINSVCYFDMSVIFESYFSDFAFNYSSPQPDPFYKECLVSLSATGETAITNKPYHLRWGTRQFDSVDYSYFKFPFWVGYPLIINSSKYYDSWIQGDYSAQGNSIETIPCISTQKTTFNFLNGQTNVESHLYYPETCPTNGNYLRWVDSLGKIWHFMFYASRDKLQTKDVKSGIFVSKYPLSISDTESGRGYAIEKTVKRSFGCFQSVDESIFPFVESILSSPIVHWYTNNKWIEVQIKDGTFTALKGGVVDIEFIVELPNDYTQKR